MAIAMACKDTGCSLSGKDLGSSWVGHRADIGAPIGSFQARPSGYRQRFVAGLLVMQDLAEIAFVDGLAAFGAAVEIAGLGFRTSPATSPPMISQV
jgi:hypothetical protein